MQYRFDEKIDLAVQKSVRLALRHFKEHKKAASESGTPHNPPTYEEFMSVLHEMMELSKAGDMNRLGSPSLREHFEKTWSQRLRSYSTQTQFKDAYDALVRRF